jgi:hypothetical protein
MNIFSKVNPKKEKKGPEPAEELKEVANSESVAETKKPDKPEPVLKPKPAEKKKTIIAMVPIFSWRTVLVVVIGLILGILVSLGYWIVSPSFGSSTTASSSGGGSSGSGLVGLLGIEPQGPYSSQVKVQVVSPGSEYIPLANLQQMGEYYAAKASSLPFLQFLVQKLNQQMPGYVYDVDKLSQMISIEYDYSSELPVIKMSVVAATTDEAIGLAGVVPQDFREYLTEEEKSQQQKQYDTTLQEIDSVKTALYQAQQEFDTLQTNETLNTNPNYIALKAKIDNLQKLLDTQAAQLVNQAVNNENLQAEYDDTLRRMTTVSNELDKANLELEALVQPATEDNPANDVNVITLNAKIKALQAELDKLMTGDTLTTGLAEMIANGDTTSSEYVSQKNKVDTVSQALADTQKQLNDINQQATQNSGASSLNYQLAQIKVDTLDAQLTALKDEVRQLYQQIISQGQDNTQSNAQTIYENTSVALADANKELADLEQQLGYDQLAADLDYKIAQDKVNNLNARLADLTQQLDILVGNNDGASEPDYLVSGNPSTPSPVLPARGRARNTLLMGAIAGAVIAWGILNYKWIIKGMPSSGPNKPEGDSQE